jgi:hypothetical protein
VRPASCNRVRMDQTCFGCSGGFGPISLPLFQGLRGVVTALVSVTVAMVLLPFFREGRACSGSKRRSDDCLVFGRSSHKALDGETAKLRCELQEDRVMNLETPDGIFARRQLTGISSAHEGG